MDSGEVSCFRDSIPWIMWWLPSKEQQVGSSWPNDHECNCESWRSYIGKSPVSDDVKHPVLLPPHSPVSNLLVKKLHEHTRPGGREQVLSQLPQCCWIIHENALTWPVLKPRVFCIRQFGIRAVHIEMAASLITPPFINLLRRFVVWRDK